MALNIYNVGTSEAAEWWNRVPWCGDSRVCCALFGGAPRVGTYSRWGEGMKSLRDKSSCSTEICSMWKAWKGEKSGVSGDGQIGTQVYHLRYWHTVYQKKHPKEKQRWPEEIPASAVKRIENSTQ